MRVILRSSRAMSQTGRAGKDGANNVLRVPLPQRTLGSMALKTGLGGHGCQRPLAKREERDKKAQEPQP